MIDQGTPEMQEREGNDYHGSCSSIQNQSQMMYVACACVGEMERRCRAMQIVGPRMTRITEMRMWMRVMVMWMSRVGMRKDVGQGGEECRMV